MDCPRDHAPLVPLAMGVVTIARCPTCRGVWASREALEAVTGSPLATRGASLALEGSDDAQGLACPSCRDRLDALETREPPIVELHACRACARLWVDDDAIASIKTSAKDRDARRARTSMHTRAPHDDDAQRDLAQRGLAQRDLAQRDLVQRDHDAPLPPPRGGPARSGTATAATVEHPFYAPGPAREAAILVGMLALASLFTWTHFGEAIAILARIQFHELGHALVAWSTGRSALPLPFGWTSWSYERSNVLVAMEWLFGVLLVIHGAREKRLAPIAIALAMMAVFALGLATPLEASEGWLVAGGITGEALLPAFALLAFHAPLPERVRWDFFRWLLALVAVIALSSVVRHDLAIGEGTRALPMGSFVSGQEGDGDLERLVADHGWSLGGLRDYFTLLGRSALGLTLVAHPLLWLVRAWRERRDARATPR